MLRRADIAAILVIAGAAAACSNPAVADRQRLASRQSQLREIASGCGLPAGALRLDGAGGIRLSPAPDVRYEVVDCTLAQLRDRSLVKHMPMAFVGNETPAEEAGNHALPH
jgi:hypothetical protein